MKTFAIFCGVILIGVLCAVLAGPVSNPDEADSLSSGSSASSGSDEDNTLSFPPYSLLPERFLKKWSDEDASAASPDDAGSEQPEGRTFFLLFRLYQLLNQLNLTSSG